MTESLIAGIRLKRGVLSFLFLFCLGLLSPVLASADSCYDECAYVGQQETNGNLIRTCGNWDLDYCLEWSQWQPINTCYDECSLVGQKQCSSSNSYQSCGNYDSDSCFEWSPAESCGIGICQSATGNCIRPPTVITKPAIITL